MRSRARTILCSYPMVCVAGLVGIEGGVVAEVMGEQAQRAYHRRTLAADALIASCYLAGTNTRRVRRALSALFAGAIGKDTVAGCGAR